MATISEALNFALQHHRAGRLQEAEALYREILQIEPRHPDALHLLGLIALHAGKPEAAVDLIGKAIAIKPGVAEYHNDMGAAYRALGRLEEAALHYQQALSINPSLAVAQYNLGLVLQRQGKLQDAIPYYEQAAALMPESAAVRNDLGNALKEQGRLEAAIACYRHALSLTPAFAEAHNNLGAALKELGHWDEAVTQYQHALSLQPDFAEAHMNFGAVLQEQGYVGEAVAHYRQALALRPDYFETLNNLAAALREQGKPDDAVACFRQALAISPDNATTRSNLLFTMLYDAADADAIAREHKSWNDVHALPLAPMIKAHANPRDSERRLRVGYVSADFWASSSNFFIEPLLSAHDHEKVEVFLYSNGKCPEAVMQSLQQLGDVWRNIVGSSDKDVAERISSDGIDILVDLSGHSAGNRLPVFARKPAPVQVTCVGYGTTTGLSAMDYRLTDQLLSPPHSQEWFSEQLVYLPNCFTCYRPPAYAPAVSLLPASSAGHVTFGSFNNLAKVTPPVVALWADILRALPTARLILKDRTFADSAQRARYQDLFLAHGVEKERIELVPKLAGIAEHLAFYERIDIGLDPFPYNGCTTTCEALWMGVPVVTLAGTMSHGRYGVTLLANMGLNHLIATTLEEYVRIAVESAADRNGLRALRAELRPRMAASIVCDAKTHAQHVERAYRMMWNIYVKGGAPRPIEVPP